MSVELLDAADRSRSPATIPGTGVDAPRATEAGATLLTRRAWRR